MNTRGLVLASQTSLIILDLEYLYSLQKVLIDSDPDTLIKTFYKLHYFNLLESMRIYFLSSFIDTDHNRGLSNQERLLCTFGLLE